ncbi:MAG: isopentenyl phosphate kinase family protein [Methanosarcinales archaeon]|nr:isopentenyl phosphate kinase family protein [Methanosarcinales archaeon]
MVRILKIGGSILTDKSRPQSPRQEEIDRIAGEIASASADLVLVHGAGSYGHMPARKFGLPQNFDREGLLQTHQSVKLLNDLVVQALVRQGLFPLPVHPLSSALLRDGRIERMDVTIIKEMVTRGIIPVLHGDVAIDSSKGAGIVSGDQLVSYLARVLKADNVSLGTDVDGVLCGQVCLKTIDRGDLPRMEEFIGGSNGVDVTGGMRGKLMELMDLADQGTPSQIFNASREGLVKRALAGEQVGTLVRRRA